MRIHRQSIHRAQLTPILPPPTDRNQRIKDARGEASKEIEELKAKKDAEFKEFERQVRPHKTARTHGWRELTIRNSPACPAAFWRQLDLPKRSRQVNRG